MENMEDEFDKKKEKVDQYLIALASIVEKSVMGDVLKFVSEEKIVDPAAVPGLYLGILTKALVFCLMRNYRFSYSNDHEVSKQNIKHLSMAAICRAIEEYEKNKNIQGKQNE